MIRRNLAVTLVAILAVTLGLDTGFARGPRDEAAHAAQIRSQIGAMRPGTLIEVRLFSREKIRGRLGESDAVSLVLQPQDPATAGRRVQFSEVKSVKWAASRGTRTVAWVVAGVLATAVIIGVAILLKERSNE